MDKIPFLGTTRTRILRQLSQGPRTAVQLASTLENQVSAVRKHLERLREMEVVDQRFERAGPGRPKKVYALTEEGRELFPRRYDAILIALLRTWLRQEGEAPVRRTLHEVAAGLAESMAPGTGSDRAHVRRLVRGLEDLGFDPTLTEEDGRVTITCRNCPVLRAAKAHRELVCDGLHAEILRAATGKSSVQRGKWIVDGDPVCTHTIPRK